MNREKLGSFNDYNTPALCFPTTVRSEQVISINERGNLKVMKPKPTKEKLECEGLAKASARRKYTKSVSIIDSGKTRVTEKEIESNIGS